jgi:multidrug resistance efflux pump
MNPKGQFPLVPRLTQTGAGPLQEHSSLGRRTQPTVSTDALDTAFDSLEAIRALQGLVDALDLPQDPEPRAKQSAHQTDDPFPQLIVSIANGTRREAIKAMVDCLAKLIPGVTIQTGIGGTKLRRYLDPNLGWLGPESELFRNFGQQWKTLRVAGTSQEPAVDTPPKVAGDQTNTETSSHARLNRREGVTPSSRTQPLDEVVLVLNRPANVASRRDDCIIIRIAGTRADAKLASDFDRWSKALATILWSRPTWSLPRWVYLNGNRAAIAVTITACLMLVALFPVPYGVNADVRIEPLAPRVVSAPFEALIEDVKVHPGDVVQTGQTLVTLDGRPLRLERQSLDAEIYQSAKQKDISLAAGRVAEAQQAQLKYQQLMRRRDLIDRRLEQLTIVSPIDGVVVSGDLRRSIGASLELGRALIEIAPLERVLVEVAIPEYEMPMLGEQAQAKIRVDASGTPTVQETITEIYPAGELREDKVVFLSLIELDNSTGAFRPGMTGKATVYGDYRPLIWPYVRRTIDQVTWLIGL